MSKLLEMICRGVFWASSLVGFYAAFRWTGRQLGAWYGLAIFILPFWLSGAWFVIRELRQARGSGLKNYGLYKDRPVD